MQIFKMIAHKCGLKGSITVLVILTLFCPIRMLRSDIKRIKESGFLYVKDVLNGSLEESRNSLLRDNSAWERENDFSATVRFIYYKDKQRVPEKIFKGSRMNSTEIVGCTVMDKFAFILHGWRESCDTHWVYELIDRLTYYRGGCIICIDYSPLAEASYMWLYRSFQLICNIIIRKMKVMISEQFDPSNGFIFGFSFGGQLALSIGRAFYSTHRFKSIDACDLAGPGFDLLMHTNDRKAAEHVQCLHSSRDKGTRYYGCHQNIRLGNCGFHQPAVFSQPYLSNHGLCVQIYINAFDYPFYAVRSNQHNCISRNPASNIPKGFTIGYNENPEQQVLGEIFVPTSSNFPYNFLQKELTNFDFRHYQHHWKTIY